MKGNFRHKGWTKKKGKFFTSRDFFAKDNNKGADCFPVSQLQSRSVFYRIARRPTHHCLAYVKWQHLYPYLDLFWADFQIFAVGHDSATTWGGEFSQELATPGKREEGRSWKWEKWRQHLNIIAFRTILWSGRRRVEILTWGVISLWLHMSFSSSPLLCIRPCKGPGK